MTKITLSCLTLLLLSAPGHAQDNSRAGPKAETGKSQDFLFEVQPREIAPGETAVLRWSIKGATKVTIAEASESGIGRPELRKIG
jgi:hypothetical protein